MGSLSKRGLGVEPCLRVTEAEESGLLKPEKKFPGRPVVLLPLPRAQVQSPVEELRSCVSCDEAKKKKKWNRRGWDLRGQDPLEGFLTGSGDVCNTEDRGFSR